MPELTLNDVEPVASIGEFGFGRMRVRLGKLNVGTGT
jgi:hypothetical protein